MDFRPTWLYVKRHIVTGMLYFGKTVRDPATYHGSGIHWKRHRSKHGWDEVETLWTRLFTDETKLVRYALRFSTRNDIVASSRWANAVPENGLGGSMPGSGKGRKMSVESSAKKSLALKGVPKTLEHNEKNRQAQLGKKVSRKTRAKLREAASNISDETRAKMSAAKKGRAPHNKGKAGPSPSNATRRKISDALRGRPGSFMGHTHSAESRAKTSQALKGRTMCASHRRKISEALTGRTGIWRWKNVDGQRVYYKTEDM